MRSSTLLFKDKIGVVEFITDDVSKHITDDVTEIRRFIVHPPMTLKDALAMYKLEYLEDDKYERQLLKEMNKLYQDWQQEYWQNNKLTASVAYTNATIAYSYFTNLLYIISKIPRIHSFGTQHVLELIDDYILRRMYDEKPIKVKHMQLLNLNL